MGIYEYYQARHIKCTQVECASYRIHIGRQKKKCEDKWTEYSFNYWWQGMNRLSSCSICFRLTISEQANKQNILLISNVVSETEN